MVRQGKGFMQGKKEHTWRAKLELRWAFPDPTSLHSRPGRTRNVQAQAPCVSLCCLFIVGLQGSSTALGRSFRKKLAPRAQGCCVAILAAHSRAISCPVLSARLLPSEPHTCWAPLSFSYCGPTVHFVFHLSSRASCGLCIF